MRDRSYELTVDLYHKVTKDRLTLTILYILTRGLGPYHTVRDVGTAQEKSTPLSFGSKNR